MKRNKRKTITMIFLIFIMIMLSATVSKADFDAQISLEGNSLIEVGEEVTLKLTTNENIVAANFKINYNSQAFELIESETKGLTVRENNGKIACIYADITLTGIKEFRVKLRAKEVIENAQFSVENVKLREKGQDTSYTEDTVPQLKQQIQAKVIKSQIVTTYNSDIIPGQNVVTIMVKNTYTDNKITKATFSEYTENVGNLYSSNGTLKGNNDIIKTGDKVEIDNQEYIVIVYGDANGDGIICDTDDIMVIINDYLGKKSAEGIYKVAANLANGDNLLDTDDLIQMINRYLGKLKNTLVSTPIKSNITISEEILNDIIISLQKDTSQFAHNLQTKFTFETNTNYQIQFKIRNDYLSTGLNIYSQGDEICNSLSITYTKIEYNQWYDIDENEYFLTYMGINDDKISNVDGIDYMSYRLYDSTNNKYSEEKTLTFKEFLQKIEFPIV